MKNISWPTAVVVSVALVALVVLVGMGADTSDLMLVIVSLLGGAGAEQLRGLRQQTNGNISRMLDELAESRRAFTALAQQRQTPPEA